MAKETKVPEKVVSATQATQRACKVRLNEIKELPEDFSHRLTGEIGAEEEEAFRQSIVRENGVRVPITFFTDPQGVKTLLCGHRRVGVCRKLAEEKQDGFTEDMLIDAIEIENGSAADHLVWSIADNQSRNNLSQDARLRLVSKLYKARIANNRAAAALGMSDSTYDRYLVVVKHDFLWEHVKNKAITHSNASKLIGLAEKRKRVQEFREDLDAWIAKTATELAEEAARKKVATGKEPAPKDLQVMGRMTPHLVRHWEKCLEADQRLGDAVKRDFHATIEDNRFKVDSVDFDVHTVSATWAGKVLAGLAMGVEKLKTVVADRKRAELNREAGEEARNKPLYDTDVLRELGLDALADEMEQEVLTSAPTAEDGVDDAEPEPEPERAEVDLAATVAVPSPAAEPSKPPTPTSPPAQPKRGKKDAPPTKPEDGEEDRPPVLKV